MMNGDLGFDLETALEKRPNEISKAKIDSLRASLDDLKSIPANITDKQLALFLGASNGAVDAARKTIKVYFDIRSKATEHFSHRDPACAAIEQCLNNQHYFILPPKDGCPIIFHQLTSPIPSNYHFDNAVKTFFMSIDVCLHKYGPQRGIIFLFDMRNVKIGHLTRAKISSIRKFFRYLQEGLPAKLCEIHVLNVVSFFDKILTLIRPFMRAEIFKVLHTYPPNHNMEEFYKKVIPSSSLPSDFGGSLESAEELNDQFRSEFAKLRDYFEAEEQQRGSSWDKYIENNNKKPAVVENFHQLNID